MDFPVSLQYLIDNELYIVSPLMEASRFVSYCRDRGIEVSLQQLETLEEHEMLFPLARARVPRVQIKIRHDSDKGTTELLEPLQPGEEWEGELMETTPHFTFPDESAKEWFAEGLLWDPRTRPFQPWNSYIGEEGHAKALSYYSPFQAFSVKRIARSVTMPVRADEWAHAVDESLELFRQNLKTWLPVKLQSARATAQETEEMAALCQTISNRYYWETQNDRRESWVSIDIRYHDWDWYRYRERWNACKVAAELGATAEEILARITRLRWYAESEDPLANWYSLVSFVAVQQKQRLKGSALLAQDLWSMEHMLRLFYRDLSQVDLPAPYEEPDHVNYLYGEGVTLEPLRFLEQLVNHYHLNPRPRLILAVEGDGEEEQFARLAKELFNESFSEVGVHVLNLSGITKFTGNKSEARYGGALRRFIDDHHHQGIIVFLVLDREMNVEKVKRDLLKKPSYYHEKRNVTRSEYIRIWSKSVEFDNFTDNEITKALTEVASGQFTFSVGEVRACRANKSGKSGDTLSALYKTKTGYGLNKRALLAALFGYIISDRNLAFDKKGKPRRKAVAITRRVLALAMRNRPHVGLDVWESGQRSGVFGTKRR